VAIVRAAIDDLGRPEHPHGVGKLTVSRTDRAQASPSARGRWPKSSAPASRRGRARACAPARKRALSPGDPDPQSFHIHPLNLALALASDIERRADRSMNAARRSTSTSKGRLAPAHAGRDAASVVARGNADLGGCSAACARRPAGGDYVAVSVKLGRRLAEASVARRDLRHRAAPAITIASSMGRLSGAAESPTDTANRRLRG